MSTSPLGPMWLRLSWWSRNYILASGQSELLVPPSLVTSPGIRFTHPYARFRNPLDASEPSPMLSGTPATDFGYPCVTIKLGTNFMLNTFWGKILVVLGGGANLENVREKDYFLVQFLLDNYVQMPIRKAIYCN